MDIICGCPLYRVLQVAQASFTIENFAKQNFLFQKKPERPVILEAVIYGWLFAWTSFMNAPAPSPIPKYTCLVIYKEPKTGTFICQRP